MVSAVYASMVNSRTTIDILYCLVVVIALEKYIPLPFQLENSFMNTCVAYNWIFYSTLLCQKHLYLSSINQHWNMHNIGLI